MKNVVIVGAGAGGASAARQLQGHFNVTVLEEGGDFKPLSFDLRILEKFKKTGLFFDEREIRVLFPSMKIQKTKDKMVLVRGSGLGGTTTLSAGNALRMDHGLKALGIDLDEEFAELYRIVPITSDHRDKWCDATERIYQACQEMGLDPKPLPKMGDYSRCTSCGRCVLGCMNGAKWDSRQFLKEAQGAGMKVVADCRAYAIEVEKGLVKGVRTQKGYFPADVVVLAAGGFQTPGILRSMGIACMGGLFVDPVLCVAAEVKGSHQNLELSMPFAVQRDHYIISPYFDHLSFFFNNNWHYPAGDVLSLMVKLADTGFGEPDGRMKRRMLNDLDNQRLQEGAELCRDIFEKIGVNRGKTFLGTLNAGHPGGMLALTAVESETMHNTALPENLYVADASLLPQALGNPPILTIMAMAMRVGKIITKRFA